MRPPERPRRAAWTGSEAPHPFGKDRSGGGSIDAGGVRCGRLKTDCDSHPDMRAEASVDGVWPFPYATASRRMRGIRRQMVSWLGSARGRSAIAVRPSERYRHSVSRFTVMSSISSAWSPWPSASGTLMSLAPRRSWPGTRSASGRGCRVPGASHIRRPQHHGFLYRDAICHGQGMARICGIMASCYWHLADRAR